VHSYCSSSAAAPAAAQAVEYFEDDVGDAVDLVDDALQLKAQLEAEAARYSGVAIPLPVIVVQQQQPQLPPGGSRRQSRSRRHESGSELTVEADPLHVSSSATLAARVPEPPPSASANRGSAAAAAAAASATAATTANHNRSARTPDLPRISVGWSDEAPSRSRQPAPAPAAAPSAASAQQQARQVVVTQGVTSPAPPRASVSESHTYNAGLQRGRASVDQSEVAPSTVPRGGNGSTGGRGQDAGRRPSAAAPERRVSNAPAAVAEVSPLPPPQPSTPRTCYSEYSTGTQTPAPQEDWTKMRSSRWG